MKAIFKGEDGSHGFKNGQLYDLISWKDRRSGWIVLQARNNQDLVCPYDDMDAILANWHIVQ